MSNMLRKSLFMKFMQSTILLSIFLSVNLLASDHKCFIEYPKSPEASAQWRNHYGDTIIQATSDGTHIHPTDSEKYTKWGNKLDARDFIELPAGTEPQNFNNKEEYKAFLIRNCGNHSHVQRALAYEATINSNR